LKSDLPVSLQALTQEKTSGVSNPLSPNKSLQRSGTHKVLGRGRPSKSAPERRRARVLKGRRAAAELGR
jgi:hypothetical protein